MGERSFATEILGFEAKTVDGKRMGKIDDIVVDTQSGELRFILLKDCTEMCGRFKTDPEGRRIVDLRTIEVADGAVIITTGS